MRVKRPRKDTVIFIVGPTAVGKTRLSIKLANRIDGEIISCDSMQIYRGMEILSQAPTNLERNTVRHHLVAELSPAREYNAAVFRSKARNLIDDIIKRKKNPIVVGGSGLYMKALVDGLFPSPKADLNFRSRMQGFIAIHGARALYKKLSKIDPHAAKKIHPNDARRIIRALELYNATGKTMTRLKRSTKGLKDVYRIKIFGLISPREEIYDDINSRVEQMFADGAIDEVKRLRKRRLSKTSKALLGLKEIDGYLRGDYDLEAAKSLIRRNTRRFAKRQLTWFRHDKRVKWFDVSRLDDRAIINKIVRETE